MSFDEASATFDLMTKTIEDRSLTLNRAQMQLLRLEADLRERRHATTGDDAVQVKPEDKSIPHNADTRAAAAEAFLREDLEYVDWLQEAATTRLAIFDLETELARLKDEKTLARLQMEWAIAQERN
tara:strand:- start:5344 stop:5721 length:378 start_codon:yes stop_codon:yes gene_type:complete